VRPAPTSPGLPGQARHVPAVARAKERNRQARAKYQRQQRRQRLARRRERQAAGYALKGPAARANIKSEPFVTRRGGVSVRRRRPGDLSQLSKFATPLAAITPVPLTKARLATKAARPIVRLVKGGSKARRAPARPKPTIRPSKAPKPARRAPGRSKGAVRRTPKQKRPSTLREGGSSLIAAGTGASAVDEEIRRVASAPYHAAKAFKEDKRVRQETVRGVKALPREFVQGTFKAVTDPKGATKGLAEQYSHLYGPLVKGDSKTFRKRLGDRGSGGVVGPALDFGLIGGPAVSRAALAAGKRGALGRKVKRITTTERPVLRYAPGKEGTKRQYTSERLVQRVRQHRRDTRRQKVHARRHAATRAARMPEERGRALDVMRPRKGEVVPRDIGRSIPGLSRYATSTRLARRQTAREKGRGRVGLLDEATRAERTFERSTGKLTPVQKDAFATALELGITRPDRLVALRAIEGRIADVRRERGRRRARGEPVRVAKTRAGSNEELARLKRVRDSLRKGEEVFTPEFRGALRRLGGLERRAAGRSVRGEGAGLSQVTLRRAKPQVEYLIRRGALPAIEDVLDTPEAMAVRELSGRVEALRGARRQATGGRRAELARASRQAVDDLERARTQLLEGPTFGTYINRLGRQRIARAAESRGLERPTYVPAEKAFKERFADKAIGGSRALAEDRRYTGELFRTGTRDVRPRVFLQGVTRSIKRKHNINLIARVADRTGIPLNELIGEAGAGRLPENLTAGARLKRPQQRTHTAPEVLEGLRQVGIDERHVVLFNPGRMFATVKREAGELADELDLGDPDIRAAFDDAAIRNQADYELRTRAADFDQERGWIAIPREAFDELDTAAGNLELFARAFDISKSQASRVLLGLLNVSWLGFQVGANTFLTGLAGVGPFEYLRAQVWWNRLSPAKKEALRPVLNIQPHQLDVAKRHTGASAGTWINRYRALKETDFWRRARVANVPRHIMDNAFRFDKAQTASFRRAVFFDATKREAMQRLGENAQGIVRIQDQLAPRMFGSKRLTDQMDVVLNDRRAIEAHAEHVDRMLGDYLTFAKTERATLQRFVMFYGFMRHSLQFTLWTMPTRHPITLGIIGKLALLSDKEKRDMFGVEDIPWELAGLQFKFRGRQVQVNVGRMSPVGNALFEARNPAALIGLLPPAISIPLSAITGLKFFTGKPARVRGEITFDAAKRLAEDPTKLGAIDRARLFLNQVEGLIPPLREARRLTFKGPQGDDAVLVLEPFGQGARPTRKIKDEQIAAEMAKQQARERSRSPLEDLLLTAIGARELHPERVAYLRRKAAESKGKKPSPAQTTRDFIYGTPRPGKSSGLSEHRSYIYGP
jgi:hypothetical protein